MKLRFWPFLIASTAFPAALLAAEGLPLRDFAGNFSKNARLEITSGEGARSRGKVRQIFRVSKSGQAAHLQITGKVKINGALRPVSVRFFFKPPNPEGEQLAATSNLAPGVDDGHSADLGIYTLTGRTIRAEIPFVIGTVTGKSKVTVTLQKVRGATQLRVTQSLFSDAMSQPVIWSFRGVRPR